MAMDEDDYSDLTDLESEEDDYGSKSRKKSSRTRGSASSGYKIKNALKVPRATTYTAQALHEQIHSGEINRDPEYQRDVVWPENKMIGIIDSIFRNFYIPPVIFAVTSHDDGSETKICIDGKQRLTSIQKFMDGLIPHKDPLSGEKLYYTEMSTGNSRSARAKRLLPEKYRRLFANKQIVCVEYQDISDQDEREIFQRVQLGMALTPAEKLQVINTPRSAFVRSLQQRFLKDSEALAGEYLDWDRTRGSDFRCLAQTVFCLDFWGPTLKNAGSIVKLEKWLNEEGDFQSSFKDGVVETFKLFSDISTDKNLGRCLRSEAYASGKLSPIEFICVGLLIGVCGVGVVGSGSAPSGGRLGISELSREIGKMRASVREEHVDIRMNDRVAKTMLEFIKGVGSAGAGAKRKRAEREKGDEELEDGEVVNGKVAKSGAGGAKGAVASPATTSTTVAASVDKPRKTMKTGSKTVGAPPLRGPLGGGGDKLAAVRAAKLQASQSASAPVSAVSGSTGAGSSSTSGSVRGVGGIAAAPSPVQYQQQQQVPPRPQLTPAQQGFHGVNGNGSGNRARLEHPPAANPALVPYQHHPQPNSNGRGSGGGYSSRRDSWGGEDRKNSWGSGSGSGRQQHNGNSWGGGGGDGGWVGASGSPTVTSSNAIPIRGGWGGKVESNPNPNMNPNSSLGSAWGAMMPDSSWGGAPREWC